MVIIRQYGFVVFSASSSSARSQPHGAPGSVVEQHVRLVEPNTINAVDTIPAVLAPVYEL